MYFITICTANRENYFGEIVETRCIASLTDMPEYEMQLNDLGKLVKLEWLKTAELRPDMNLELAEYVVMPNHFHGIIIIGDNQYNTSVYNTDRELEPSYLDMNHLDAKHRVSADQNINDNSKNKFSSQSKNLASILRGFKSAVTTYARINDIPFNWQPRFHDHIITKNEEYLRIADYIINNPRNWQRINFISDIVETRCFASKTIKGAIIIKIKFVWFVKHVGNLSAVRREASRLYENSKFIFT